MIKQNAESAACACTGTDIRTSILETTCCPRFSDVFGSFGYHLPLAARAGWICIPIIARDRNHTLGPSTTACLNLPRRQPGTCVRLSALGNLDGGYFLCQASSALLSWSEDADRNTSSRSTLPSMVIVTTVEMIVTRGLPFIFGLV